jgi:hypothetical protein
VVTVIYESRTTGPTLRAARSPSAGILTSRSCSSEGHSPLRASKSELSRSGAVPTWRVHLARDPKLDSAKSTCAAHPTNPTPSQAPGTGYAVALPSTHPHPRAIRATPLIFVIAPRCGKFSAAISRWRCISLRRHVPPRKQGSPQMCMGRQSLPCATRHHRICQCLGVTLACTARPQAVKPQRHSATAGPQCPTAGARDHHWFRNGRAR